MTEPVNNDTPQFDAKRFLSNVTRKTGVYVMLDAAGDVLYVGKAKNLRNRLSSYFRASGLTSKTMALVSRIAQIEVTVTASEGEALLLEQNLIKENKPPYNILLRDDKSYPYIYLSDHRHPRLSLHRGSKRGKGQYFGPYPSASAVRESLNWLQKVFKVRQCEDSYYRDRSRPCLQYQIGRVRRRGGGGRAGVGGAAGRGDPVGVGEETLCWLCAVDVRKWPATGVLRRRAVYCPCAEVVPCALPCVRSR